MQNLDKILEEIDREIEERRKDPEMRDVDICYGLNRAKEIIRKHMNDGWIPVEERLPEDDGEYCTQYQIMTKYGVTEGWYRPNENVWYVLLWRHLSENGEIDFEKGDIPTLELINPEIRTDIIIAWMPLPDPYRPEPLETRKELEEDSKGVRENERD